MPRQLSNFSHEPIPHTFSIIVFIIFCRGGGSLSLISQTRDDGGGGGRWRSDARPAVAMQKRRKFAIQMSSNEKLKRSDTLPGQLTETRNATAPSAAALLEGPGEAHQRERGLSWGTMRQSGSAHRRAGGTCSSKREFYPSVHPSRRPYMTKHPGGKRSGPAGPAGVCLVNKTRVVKPQGPARADQSQFGLL